MSWLTVLIVLLALGVLIGNMGLIGGVVRGEKDAKDLAIRIVAIPIIGMYEWDSMGREAVGSAQQGSRLSVITIVVVTLVYIFSFKLWYKVICGFRDLLRRAPMISPTREKILLGSITIILIGVLTLGFRFWVELVRLLI